MKISGRIVLKKGKEISLRRFHPWIFSGALEKMEGDIDDGVWVDVVDRRGEVLGYGHYQHGSIAVRLLSFDAAPPSEDFYEQRLSRAFSTRLAASLPSAHTNCFRIVHGEGDGLPGLIIDYYDGIAVVQAHSAGTHCFRAGQGVGRPESGLLQKQGNPSRPDA